MTPAPDNLRALRIALTTLGHHPEDFVRLTNEALRRSPEVSPVTLDGFSDAHVNLAIEHFGAQIAARKAERAVRKGAA